MAEMASLDRLRRLPLYLVHGALDWMFPVEVARQTHRALAAAGAAVVYRNSTISAIVIRARSTRPCWRGCGDKLRRHCRA